jgi:hypothetical protein
MLFEPSRHAPWWTYLTMALAVAAGIAATVAAGGALGAVKPPRERLDCATGAPPEIL